MKLASKRSKKKDEKNNNFIVHLLCVGLFEKMNFHHWRKKVNMKKHRAFKRVNFSMVKDKQKKKINTRKKNIVDKLQGLRMKNHHSNTTNTQETCRQKMITFVQMNFQMNFQML